MTQDTMLPMSALRYDEKEGFPVKAAHIFYEEGFMDDDPYSYTMRVSVCHESNRADLRRILRRRLPRDQAQRLIELLDENDWEVSFFVGSVDC